MVHSIFFDLETSDRNPIGQILNYCFLEVDENFTVVNECKGLVSISRTEIPDPGAILANRINVLDHQQQARRNEHQAASHIYDFIQSVIEKQNQPVPFVGYNSSRFDVPFLRTTFIRNGINPYFQNKILCRDVYHIVQKAFLTCPLFTEPLIERGKKLGKLSLGLEAVSQTFGLLKGVQAHESEFDVLLTIDVAKMLAGKFQLDVRSHDVFEVGRFFGKGPVVVRTFYPNYELDSECHRLESNLMLLTNDHRSSLWVDLKMYHDGRAKESIRWLSMNRHAVVVDQEVPIHVELDAIVQKARKEFKDVTLKNFFTKSTCDIEQDIYRVDFEGIRLLGEATISGSDLAIKATKNRDLRVLFVRWRLRNAQSLSSVERGEEFLRLYAINRYGGEAMLSKTIPTDGVVQFHDTLRFRLAQIDERKACLSNSTEMRDKESLELLHALEQFILQSDIFRLAGDVLLDQPAGKAAG